MTQLADVHEAVASCIRARVGRDLNVSAWPASGMPLPRIEVWPATGEDYADYYGESYADQGAMAVNLLLRIDVSTVDAETAGRIITDLISWDGASSLRAALMFERTLGGVVDDVTASNPTWEIDEFHTAWIPIHVVVQKETP